MDNLIWFIIGLSAGGTVAICMMLFLMGASKLNDVQQEKDYE